MNKAILVQISSVDDQVVIQNLYHDAVFQKLSVRLQAYLGHQRLCEPRLLPLGSVSVHISIVDRMHNPVCCSGGTMG